METELKLSLSVRERLAGDGALAACPLALLADTLALMQAHAA